MLTMNWAAVATEDKTASKSLPAIIQKNIWPKKGNHCDVMLPPSGKQLIKMCVLCYSWPAARPPILSLAQARPWSGTVCSISIHILSPWTVRPFLWLQIGWSRTVLLCQPGWPVRAGYTWWVELQIEDWTTPVGSGGHDGWGAICWRELRSRRGSIQVLLPLMRNWSPFPWRHQTTRNK